MAWWNIENTKSKCTERKCSTMGPISNSRACTYPPSIEKVKGIEFYA